LETHNPVRRHAAFTRGRDGCHMTFMTRNPLSIAAYIVTMTFGSACAPENQSARLLPTTPDPIETTLARQAPSSAAHYLGTWTSVSVTIPPSGSCSNFQWRAEDATVDALAGSFSADCAGNATISGTASGAIEGTAVSFTVSGTATYARAVSCEFSLTGAGTIENDDTVTIPYSGTTCLGSVSGTEVLQRTDGPADPLFGCEHLREKELVTCIWNHVRPTDNDRAFEVTKRVAWALRGDGAGLLIKNGGENVTDWQGRRFSSSRICYPDGRLVKVIYDAGPGGANGPSWQDYDDYVDESLYAPPMDPLLP
jgi:hypothetical protein